MNSIGLAALLGPHTNETFLNDFWGQKPLAVLDLKDRVSSLTSLPFLQSLDALLNSWPEPIQAHLPDVSDESSSVDTTSKDARKLFANKMALLFNNVQNISPELQHWLAVLGQDLGLPNSTQARCMVYATPDGKGTAAHFDQNVNFVIQIHGIKKWKLAPNASVVNPTQRFTIGQPTDPELAGYSENMPSKMPQENIQEIVLKPGSMLFVPRGFWHSTEAEGEAMALNFTFSQPTWIDLFTLALRSRLSLSPDWRALADGVTSLDPKKRLRARNNLGLLLSDLVEDLPNWQAEDIIGATEGDFD